MWLTAKGDSTVAILDATGLGRTTFQMALRRYNTVGPDGLRDRRHDNPGQAPPAGQRRNLVVDPADGLHRLARPGPSRVRRGQEPELPAAAAADPGRGRLAPQRAAGAAGGTRPAVSPSHSPELQPAERLWPLVDEAVANRVITDLDHLQSTLAARCLAISSQTELARGLCYYHGWRDAVEFGS